MTAEPLGSRDERDDDISFLRELYASTRLDELAPLGWDPAELDAFLTMQFDAQRAHYRDNYPDADFLVLTFEARPVGRLYVDRHASEVVVIDIALLPDYRNSGHGTQLMHDVIDDATRAGKTVRLSVDKTNPATRLYQRLGFATIGDHGLSWQMQWRPPPASPEMLDSS